MAKLKITVKISDGRKITNTKIKSSVNEFKGALDTVKEMHFELEVKAKGKK